MLSFAQRADLKEWPGVNRSGQSLTFAVLAQRVEDLEPGFYEYDSAKGLLRSGRVPLRPDEIVKLYVQGEFAAAPLAIWIAGNLAEACARHGAFGHRQLLLRAGAAGNRMWMAALGLGLGGTLVAGIDASASRKILGIDGYLKRALFAVAIGYPGRENLPAVELHS
jgi:nitroreductase